MEKNMNKFIYGLCCLFLLLTGCNSQDSQKQTTIKPNEIYFFYAETCPHCHDADDYIKKNLPDLPVNKINVATKEGYGLFVKCAKKFKLGNEIGTPLFCMGDKYLMGWSPAYAKRFDRYAKPFMK